MKHLKKYSLYIWIVATVLVLGTASYIAENRRLAAQKPAETSYTPPAVAVEKPEPRVFEEPKTETASTFEDETAVPTSAQAAQEDIPLAFSSPIDAGVSVGYSQNEMMYSETMGDYRTHNGIDYAADEGTDVVAAAYGTVSDIYTDDYFGLTVTIDHGGGLASVYSSLSESFVSVGDTVERGDRIAAVGNSAATETAEGAHLHFEARKDGKVVNPAELMN